MKLYNLLPVLFIVLAVTGGCTQQAVQQDTIPPAPIVGTPIDTAPADTPPPPDITQTDTPPPVPTPINTVKEFTMTAERWEFTPRTITVNEGDTVKLRINSIDVTHGFGLSAFGINEKLSPGDIIDIEFVADKKGTFRFLCTISCGAGHSGMRGQLIVE